MTCKDLSEKQGVRRKALRISEVPELASQFHKTKNGSMTPENVSVRSRLPCWWFCPICEREWDTPPDYRKNKIKGKYKGCPYCSNQRVHEDNCLAKTNPELAKQWNQEENGHVTPHDVIAGSDKKFSWMCDNCKKSWKTSIKHRSQGKGCPNCKESKGEKIISKILDKMGLEFKRQVKFEGCKNKNYLPFDFFIEGSKSFLIEYQGEQHYLTIRRNKSWSDKKCQIELEKTQKRDRIKSEWASKNDIPLLIIPYWERSNISDVIENFLEVLPNNIQTNHFKQLTKENEISKMNEIKQTKTRSNKKKGEGKMNQKHAKTERFNAIIKILNSNDRIDVKMVMNQYKSLGIGTGNEITLHKTCWEDLKELCVLNKICMRKEPVVNENGKKQGVKNIYWLNLFQKENSLENSLTQNITNVIDATSEADRRRMSELSELNEAIEKIINNKDISQSNCRKLINKLL